MIMRSKINIKVVFYTTVLEACSSIAQSRRPVEHELRTRCWYHRMDFAK